MAQSTITSFFNNRKRPATDDIKGRSKVMALDSGTVITGYGDVKLSEISDQPTPCIKVEATVVVSNEEASQKKSELITSTSAPKSKTPARSTRKAVKPRDSKQSDMKTFLQSNVPANKSTSGQETSVKRESSTTVTEDLNIVNHVQDTREEMVSEVEIKAENVGETELSAVPTFKLEPDDVVCTPPPLSGERHANQDVLQKNNAISSSCPDTTTVQDVKEMAPAEKKESNIEKARRELCLGDIKSKLTRSARLAELKASMARFEESRDKLKKFEQTKKSEKNAAPQLSQFNSIQLEVPASPSKSPMKSPLKSPLKSPAGSRSPAFQRYAGLALAGPPALPLPFSYRHLAELFHCVDTVSCMFFNRKEMITFSKLQPAVQKMGRKAFTKTHLAQMMTVYPESYTLKQEKLNSFGVLSKSDKYELVLTPVLESKADSDNEEAVSMTSFLLGRKREFFNKMLKIVKGHHQEFLLSLEPPMVVPVESLTRWHPEFAVDQVPEITPAELPQPPNLEKCNSAMDVLAKAREARLLSCNSRMEKALVSVAQSDNSKQVPSVNIKVVDSPSAPNNPPTSPFKSMQLSSALKGIPKALLEKVRAKQAARALEAMTRTSAQDKEAMQHSRLPEIARILRNIFVAEKKGSLQLEFVLEKLGDSYRTALTQKELIEHLHLIAKAVPNWLAFKHLLHTDYLTLCKKADMNRVLERLNRKV